MGGAIPRKTGRQLNPGASGKGAKLPIRDQLSAGGVVFRFAEGITWVVLISVGPQARWQLPKGLVDAGESPEVTAVREAREEAGVVTELLSLIDTVEYWFVGTDGAERVRFHKRVHFYLLRYVSGDTQDHDWEVNEARWAPIENAVTMLAFDGERRIIERARELIDERSV